MTPPPSDANVRLIVIAVVAALVIIAVGGTGVGLVLAVAHGATLARATGGPKPSPSPVRASPVSATTPLTAKTGAVIFTDDFHDPQSGWFTGSAGSDVNYAFVNGAFVTIANGGFSYPAASPYTEPTRQLGVGATATLDLNTPPDAGFGVDCVRGSGPAQVSYQFTADADSNWAVVRWMGPNSETNFPTTLKQGSIRGAPAPGAIPVTLVGVCATMADGSTTRLAFFIDGSKVADFTDMAASSPDGWGADLVINGSDSGPVTMTASHFDERDLSRGGA